MRDRGRVCLRDRKRVRGKAYKNFLAVGQGEGEGVREAEGEGEGLREGRECGVG